MYKIYKIKNKKHPSEIYVGSTKQTLKDRFHGHVYNKNSSVYPYIKKYGKENFEISIIDYAENKKEALEKEEFWTIFYAEQGYFLYNKQAGTIPSDETKRKISEAKKGKYTGKNSSMYGKHLSDEAKRKISIKTKERMKNINNNPFHIKPLRGENHPWFNRHHSKETKQKLRKKNGKAVRCIDDGKCFVSCTEAAEYYNIGASGIRDNCRGEIKSTHDLHFEYI